MRPGGCGMRRMTLSAVTDLPEPDSPTIPSVSPLLMNRSTPSTARTTPSSVKKCVLSPLTSRSRSAMEPPVRLPATRQLAKRLERPRDIFGVHVLVGHAADGGGARRVHLHLASRAALDELVGRGGAALNPHDHDIRLHGVEIDLEARHLREALREPPRIDVILGEPIDHAL